MKIALTQEYPSNASELAFPLGGIGTGNVSLGVRGDFRDWEIFNHPGKGVSNPNTFFSIWVKEGLKPPVCKILEGRMQAPYTNAVGFQPFTVAGLPHFNHTRFFGEYPLSRIDFEDPDIPLEISLEAFTPLIPLQADDSGLPCAILTYSIKNVSNDTVSLSLIGSVMNPIGEIRIDSEGNIIPDDIGLSRNEFYDTGFLRAITLSSERYQKDELKYGNLCLATNHQRITYKRAWLRGDFWYDYLREFWNDLRSDGILQDLQYDTSSPIGKNDTGSLGVLDDLQPGQTGTYSFFLSWYFPNRPKSWKQCCTDQIIRNHYATRFGSALDVARYVAENLIRLEDNTYEFHRAIYSSTIPSYVKDALSANIVPLRSTTCFWHEDGNFYGWEGCCNDKGCCAGTCTHVWSYAQTVAYLFPELERNMRLIEFTKETDDEGFMFFRNYQNFGERHIWPWGDQKPEAAIDGQMGSILRVLREWRISGDIGWLSDVWEGVKRALQFVSTHWDTDGDGMPDGSQHNTYDINFYGPNPLGAIYYLAGLRAVEELAAVMGENDLADRSHQSFLDVGHKVDSLLWGGEYYIQKLDDINKYKYQFGIGCLSDQLLGQLHAKMLNLGYLLPSDHVRTTIKSIYDNNFKRNFFNHQNCQRTFVFNDESGLILCSWPNGGEPIQPFVYSDEVWTGVEYEIATLLIYEGMVENGLELIKAIRRRQDGIRRNPWNEVECGNHYARSMASWALLLALSGFQYDAHSSSISFRPVYKPENFRCLYNTGSSWGSYSQVLDTDGLEVNLEVIHGSLQIKYLKVVASMSNSTISARIGPEAIPAEFTNEAELSNIMFEPNVLLQQGQRLSLRLT